VFEPEISAAEYFAGFSSEGLLTNEFG